MTAIEIFGLLGWGFIIAVLLFTFAFILMCCIGEIIQFLWPPRGKERRPPPPPYPPP